MKSQHDDLYTEFLDLQSAYKEKCEHYRKLVRRVVNQTSRFQTLKDNLIDTSCQLSSFFEVLQTPDLDALLFVRQGLSDMCDSYYSIHGGALIDYFINLSSVIEVDLLD